MKEKMFSLFVIVLFLSTFVSSLAYAETKTETSSSDEIHIATFGSSILIGIRRVGFVMTNIGENKFNDVSWTFTATRTEDNEIVYLHSDIAEDFPPDLSTIFSVHLPNDIGYLELTATATCSELENELSNTITVFQLGPICMGRSFLFCTPF